MLQFDKTSQVHSPRGDVWSEDTSSGELITEFSGLVRRRLPLIAAFLVATLGLGIAYLATATPLYTAQTNMIVDAGKVQLFQQQSVLDDVPLDSELVDSQVQILKSESIALSVINAMHLDRDPEFIGSGAGPIARIWNGLSHLFGASTPKSEFARTRAALNRFERQLSVRRIGLTYVVQISFESGDPQRAADVANAVAEAYINDQLQAKYQTTHRAGNWMQNRLKDLGEQATAAELAVVRYKTRNNIVETGEPNNRLMGQQQISELDSTLVQARAATAEAKARLDRLNQILATNAIDPASTDSGTVTDTLHNDVITKLRQQYLEIAQRESDWATRYGQNHLAVVDLRNQMQEIRHSIADELNRIAQTYASDYDIAKARQSSIQQSLDASVAASQTTSKAQIELSDLESTAQSYRTLYNSFLQRYVESVQQQSFPISESRVITTASRPLTKSSPKASLVLTLATMAGLMFGLGAAVLRDKFDRVFRSVSQVEASLKIECTAVVPEVQPKIGAPRIGPTKDVSSRKLIVLPELFRYLLEFPLSRFAESVRGIRVGVDLANVGRVGKVIGITSSIAGEGKTTIAASLALQSASAGARVILVDCDLREAGLTKLFAPGAMRGLTEALTTATELREVIWSEADTGLSLLPLVLKSSVCPSDVLGSEMLRQLFDRLREMYDYVIVDLSPATPVVDVRASLHLMDGYVFVIEWGRTQIELVEHAVNTARGLYDRIVGVVLNKADLKLLRRHDPHTGHIQHDRYYVRYSGQNGRFDEQRI